MVTFQSNPSFAPVRPVFIETVQARRARRNKVQRLLNVLPSARSWVGEEVAPSEVLALTSGQYDCNKSTFGGWA